MRYRWDPAYPMGRRDMQDYDARLRASDDERNAVADKLSRHYAEGRLDEVEFKNRLDTAMSATTRGDLNGLFDDLPRLSSEPPPPPPRSVPARPRSARPVSSSSGPTEPSPRSTRPKSSRASQSPRHTTSAKDNSKKRPGTSADPARRWPPYGPGRTQRSTLLGWLACQLDNSKKRGARKGRRRGWRAATLSATLITARSAGGAATCEVKKSSSPEDFADGRQPLGGG